MAKEKVEYVCQHCDQNYPRWQGQCTSCGEWNTLIQQVISPSPAMSQPDAVANMSLFTSLKDVEVEMTNRWLTGLDTFDELIGGGLVPGAITLIGGEPGVGKSTFMLQLASKLGLNIKPLAYISGEESATQVKIRSERLRIGNDKDIIMVAEQNLDAALKGITSFLPRMLVVDSIQAIYTSKLDSMPGSASQIRECSAILTKFGKDRNMPVFIIGHVTKDGSIAGPKILEHIVDTVLYFEGDINSDYRILRVFKNRFGATGEVAIFQMTDKGLTPIINPSDVFISRQRTNSPGVVVVPVLQGTRCILTELQTLATHSFLNIPRRVVSGLDSNRLNLIIAVLEKHVGMKFYNRDVFVNIAGGLKLTEPGGDLGLAMALVGSYSDQPLPEDLLFVGELTLSGEIRPVAQTNRRINEGKRFGFKRFMIAEGTDNLSAPEFLSVRTVRQAVDMVKKMT